MGRKKKQEDETDRDSYIGRRVEKNFEGFGKYAGSVVAYNAARHFYKVVYDDGDREELEIHELEPILVHVEVAVPPSGKRGRPSKEEPQVDETDSKRQTREPSSKQSNQGTRRKDGGDSTRITRQGPPMQKRRNCEENEKDAGGHAEGDAFCAEEDRENGAVARLDMEGDVSTRTSKRKRQKLDQDCAPTLLPVKSTRTAARGRSVISQNLLQDFEDASDGDESSDYEGKSDADKNEEIALSDGECVTMVLANVPEEPNLPPIVPLPPSSNSFPLPGDFVAEGFAVYSFLRSFSHALFLSPFTFDDFVSALVAERANHLIDSIHLILLQALRRHLQRLSKDDCTKARECLRQLDWSFLDNVTWPSFLMVFLATQGFAKCYGQRIGSLPLLDAEYYKASGKLKLAILSFLCDHALETEEIRAVMDARELEFERQVGQKEPRYKVIDAEEGQQPPFANEDKLKAFDDTLEETNTCSIGNLHVASKSVQEESSPDGNADECVLCGMNGNLICCDGCPAAYHSRCVGIARASLPPGDWFCPECIVEKIGGEQSRRTRGLQGCYSLGVDPYGRTFMVTCGHLLVLSPSDSTQFDYNYYNKNDILQVIQALEGQAPFCTGVACAIRQYWDISFEQLARPNNPQLICEATGAIFSNGPSNSEQIISLQESSKALSNEHKVTSLDVLLPEVAASCTSEIPLPTKSIYSSHDSTAAELCEPLLVVEAFAEVLAGTDDVSQYETAQQVASDMRATSSSSNIPDARPRKCDLNVVDPCLDTPSTFPSKAVLSTPQVLKGMFASRCGEVPAAISIAAQRQHIIVHSLKQDPFLSQKIADRDSKGRFLTASSREQLLSDTSQKPVPRLHLPTDQFVRISAYINHYAFGDAAATAAANLALMSGDETDLLEKGTRKLRKTGTTIAEQVNAFCKAPARFSWPSSRKKLMEAPKDRCGWCFSCTSCMKRGCLLNQAASQLAAGAARVSGGIRPGKYGYGHLPGVVGYILYMEEILQSFLTGPWENMMFRKFWRKKLEQPMSIGDVKASLLNLEANLRLVVLIEDWSKCLEDAPLMALGGSVTSLADNSFSKKASGKKSSRRSGASRQELPNSGNTTVGHVQWTRRGKVAHRVAGWATLPTKVARKAGRQGGLKKIAGITYVDNEEVPKRSKQTAWRARVQAANTVAELAVQVRCLDCLLRWDDLSSKSEVHASSKVCEEDGNQDNSTSVVHAKSFKDNVIMYLVDSILVPRQSLRQNASLPGLSQSCNGQQVWVEERQVPLHLLKEFEDKERSSRQSQAPKSILLQKYLSEAMKAPKKDIIKFLWERAGFSTPTKLVMSITCKFCSSKVLASLAVQCHLCKEPFHKECTVASHAFGKHEMKHTCCGCLKQLVQKKSTTLNSVKQEPAVSSQKQGNENFRPAVNPPNHQKRVVISQPKPQKLALKLPLKASTLEAQAKEDTKKEGSQGSSKDVATRNVEKSFSEGVYWKKNGASSRMRFEKNLLFPIQGEPCKEAPKCFVCKQHFRGDLIYVKCEFCPLWFHGDALGVNKGNLDEVLGFKCNKCRKKGVPPCPYGTAPRMHKHVARSSLPTSGAPSSSLVSKGSLVQEPYVTKRSPLPLLRVAENQEIALPTQEFTPKVAAEIEIIKPNLKYHRFVNGYPQLESERSVCVEGLTPLKPLQGRHQLENQSRPSRFGQLMEDSTPSNSSADTQPPENGRPVENGATLDSLLGIQHCVKEEAFDQCVDEPGDIDCALSEDGQELSAGDETLLQDDVIEDGSLNGESSAQPTLSFMELLSSEDDRVEVLADVAMDFGADGFDVFDLDTILGNFESIEPLAEEDMDQIPVLENQSVSQSLGAAVDAVCSVCSDVSRPFDLQCGGCGLAVHQHCLNADQSGKGTWISHSWACDACKGESSQSQG